MIWLIASRDKKKTLFGIFAIGILVTLALRIFIHLDSSRYMFTPVLLAFPVMTFAAVVLWDWCKRSRRGVALFLLLALCFTACSVMKFVRKSKNPRDQVILRSAEIAREDFLASRKIPEALFVSNGNNIGLIFIYSGVPGKFYQLEFDDMKRFDTQLQLLCSQYPLVYLLKEYRHKGKLGDERIFSASADFPHSYRVRKLAGAEQLAPNNKYGRFELLRIESLCRESHDEWKISAFVDAPQLALQNGDFSQWSERRRIAIDRSLGNKFLNEQPEQRLPAGWGLDLGNRRGRDFTQWKFEGAPSAARVRLRFEAPDGGFALKSAQQIPVGDCRVSLAGTFSLGCKLLVFLYVYDGKRAFLLHQNAGVWQSVRDGRALVSVPIRQSSFPADAAFFSIGVIGWHGNYTIRKIDLSTVQRKDHE